MPHETVVKCKLVLDQTRFTLHSTDTLLYSCKSFLAPYNYTLWQIVSVSGELLVTFGIFTDPVCSYEWGEEKRWRELLTRKVLPQDQELGPSHASGSQPKLTGDRMYLMDSLGETSVVFQQGTNFCVFLCSPSYSQKMLLFYTPIEKGDQNFFDQFSSFQGYPSP